MNKTIVRYANRKLYDKNSRKYVNLANLSEMIDNGVRFTVIDHRTQNDITRNTLINVLANKLSMNNTTDSQELIELIYKG